MKTKKMMIFLLAVLFLAVFTPSESSAVMLTMDSSPVSKDVFDKYKAYANNTKPIDAPVKETATGSPVVIKDVEEFIPIDGIKMPAEHQKYLYYLTTNRGLHYKKTLAILKHESQFNMNVIAVNDYGYMQINQPNHAWLSKSLNTPNMPLNPYVNMFWGTFMLEDLYQHWEREGIKPTPIAGSPFTVLDKYVMSSYNKGITGFKTHGEATSYIGKVEKELYLIDSWLKR